MNDINQKNAYCYFSYDRSDFSKFSNILKCLESSIISIYYDKSENYENLWETRISEKIINAQAVFIYVTKQSLTNYKTSFMYKEYEIAKYYDKNIILLFAEEIDDSDLNNDTVLFFHEICNNKKIELLDKNIKDIPKHIFSFINLNNLNSLSKRKDYLFLHKLKNETKNNIIQLLLLLLLLDQEYFNFNKYIFNLQKKENASNFTVFEYLNYCSIMIIKSKNNIFEVLKDKYEDKDFKKLCYMLYRNLSKVSSRLSIYQKEIEYYIKLNQEQTINEIRNLYTDELVSFFRYIDDLYSFLLFDDENL